MPDPITAMLDTAIKVIPTGALSTIGIIFLYQKFIRNGVQSTPKALQQVQAHPHPELMNREACSLKEKRMVNDIKQLKKNDEKHFEFQETSVSVLNRLDTRTQLIAQKLEIKEET